MAARIKNGRIVCHHFIFWDYGYAFVLIPFYSLLDPRISPFPPVENSVWIPLPELASRQHELPAKSQSVTVINCQEADAACSLINDLGRIAVVTDDFEYGNSLPGRLWEPNSLLIFSPNPGKALDMGCGSGRDAIFLSSLGWELTAVDHLPDAIALAQKLERRYFDSPKVNWVVADASAVEPDEFDLIISFRFLDRVALARSLRFLKPGGLFMLEALSRKNRELTGSPRNPDWCASMDEFETLFPGFEPIHMEEGFNHDKHTVRMVGRKIWRI